MKLFLLCGLLFVSIVSAEDGVCVVMDANGKMTAVKRGVSEVVIQRATSDALAVKTLNDAWQFAFTNATNQCQKVLGVAIKDGSEFKTRAAEIAISALVKAQDRAITAEDLANLNAALFALDILSR